MIDVICVNYNTSALVAILYDSLKATAKGDFVVHVCDNGSYAPEIERLQEIAKTRNIKLYFRQQRPSSRTPSLHNGEAVDFVLNQLTGDNYILFFDIDCFMFQRNWDVLFTRLLEHEKFDCIGSVTHIPGHITPHLAFVRRSKLKEYNIDWMPAEDLYYDKDGVLRERANNLLDTGFKINRLPKKIFLRGEMGLMLPLFCRFFSNQMFFLDKQPVAFHWVGGGGAHRHVSEEAIQAYAKWCSEYRDNL